MKMSLPIILGHRGAKRYAPENTLAAFLLALEQGADGVELDAKLSADGVVVVIHDPTVERTTNGTGRVADLPLTALRELDAGGWFSDQFRGEKIPTLEEVFEALGKRALINVELTNYTTPQDRLVEKVCELVRRHGMQKNVLFSSFYPWNLTQAARLLPEVPRGLLTLQGWKGLWGRSFGFMFGDYQALHPYYTDVTPQQVQRVHRLKRTINVWSVEQEQDLRRLIAWGVDGIITPDPVLAVRVARGEKDDLHRLD